MPLPDALLLPPPRQPTPEIRAGRAYRALSGGFMVLLSLGIALFVTAFLVPSRWFWHLWAAAATAIFLIVPLRAWGTRRGLLSYYIYGTAVEGRVAASGPAGGDTVRLRVRYVDGAGGERETECLVFDAPEAPLRPGDPVPVLFRPGDPGDCVLPTLAGIFPDGVTDN